MYKVCKQPIFLEKNDLEAVVPVGPEGNRVFGFPQANRLKLGRHF